jgi:hypothetical protein
MQRKKAGHLVRFRNHATQARGPLLGGTVAVLKHPVGLFILQMNKLRLRAIKQLMDYSHSTDEKWTPSHSMGW